MTKKIKTIQKITLHTLKATRELTSRKDIVAFVCSQPDVMDQYTKEKTIHNFIYKAKTRLIEMGLIIKKGRGNYALTPSGNEMLEKSDDDICVCLREWVMQSSRDSKRATTKPTRKSQRKSTRNATLSKRTDTALKENSELKTMLVNKLEAIKPLQFKRIVKHIMQVLHYTFEDVKPAKASTAKTKLSGFVTQDQLGVRKLYVEGHCSRNQLIGLSEMNTFLGVLTSMHAKEGLFITTSQFSSDSKQWAEDQGIVLIDRDALANHMIKHNIGTKLKENVEIKELDPTFF